jgi:DNA-entry nuclease
MKFGEKKRLQKEQERFEKQQAQKKKNKKQITILVSILAVLFVIVGIGALTENNAKNLPDSSAIVSSTSGAETPESTISETPSKESESSQEKTTSPETTQAPTAQTQQPTSTVVSIDDIPSYSGSGAYIAINNNVPYFTEADYTTAAFENYSSLDSLGRCGVAYANVCQEIMPTEDRGSIGQVKPTGWHTVKYDCVDGKYLYNRCHLIGYQLSAENANTKNLITGTRYLNVDGMLPFENMVADYIKETNHHVLYRVTPMFDGDNLVATGVLMEALSVEDKGDGICFNVFCYNIQPGVTIDYATGDSTLNETAATTTPAAETTAPASEPSTGTTYILNTNTHKFHYPSCSSVSQMNEANKQEYTGSRDDLIAQGYEPCGRCHP